jgi:hypothetical protein
MKKKEKEEKGLPQRRQGHEDAHKDFTNHFYPHTASYLWTEQEKSLLCFLAKGF